MVVKRLVLDVVKPVDPSIVELAKTISNVEGVDGVNISLIEIDKRVENVKITIEGKLDEKKIFEVIESFGAAIHSVDEVVAGKKMVEHVVTMEEL